MTASIDLRDVLALVDQAHAEGYREGYEDGACSRARSGHGLWLWLGLPVVSAGLGLGMAWLLLSWGIFPSGGLW